MAKKNQDTDGGQGAPEWMVTFSDCMTLLLTFFVLLLSFSSFDEKEFFKRTSCFRGAFSSISGRWRQSKDSLLRERPIQPTREPEQGSEKPTLRRGQKNRAKKETQPRDFRGHKVFVLPSSRLFWAKGAVLSFEGRKTLSLIAALLKTIPNRVVISETGPDDDSFNIDRAWSVLKFFTQDQGLDAGRFNISAASLTGDTLAERKVEIVLLERSICN